MREAAGGKLLDVKNLHVTSLVSSLMDSDVVAVIATGMETGDHPRGGLRTRAVLMARALGAAAAVAAEVVTSQGAMTGEMKGAVHLSVAARIVPEVALTGMKG